MAGEVRLPGQAADVPAAKVFAYRLDPDHKLPPLVTSKELQSGTTYATTWSFLDSTGRDRQAHEVSPASTEDKPKTIVTDTRYDDAGHVAAESLPVLVDGGTGSAPQAVPGDHVIETRHSYDALGRDTKAAQFAQGKELWNSSTAYFGDHQRTTPPAGGVVKTSWTDLRGRQLKTEDGTGASIAATTYTYYSVS